MLTKRVLILTIGLLLIFNSCSILPNSPGVSTVFPVLIDPRSAYWFDLTDDNQSFPFDVGDLVEVPGFLIYHGVSEDLRVEVLETAQWSASLYPTGELINEETMAVQVQSISNPAVEYEFSWYIDVGDVLLVVAETPLPEELFVSPQIGDTTEVCLTMRVDQVISPQTDGIAILVPYGEAVDNLLLSEIRFCQP
jgi:hypothetical protein